jgi:hypothetical protein
MLSKVDHTVDYAFKSCRTVDICIFFRKGPTVATSRLSNYGYMHSQINVATVDSRLFGYISNLARILDLVVPRTELLPNDLEDEKSILACLLNDVLI